MKISPEMREYDSAKTDSNVDKAIDAGMAAMTEEFDKLGRKLYRKVQHLEPYA